jgi:hypothetical protein
MLARLTAIAGGDGAVDPVTALPFMKKFVAGGANADSDVVEIPSQHWVTAVPKFPRDDCPLEDLCCSGHQFPGLRE